VFDPLVSALRGCRRLFIAPDAELCTVPFEVLPLGDRRLVDDYHVSYLTTGRDVLRFGARPGVPATDPVVIANPNFDLSSSSGVVAKAVPVERQSRDLARATQRFEPLPGTGEEGTRVAERLGVRPWLRDEALEGRLKARRSPRVLHVATHGFFLADEVNPRPDRASDRLFGAALEDPLLRSGLALAGANTWRARGVLPPEAEDGILNAADVSQLDLGATDLAVLSACETGLGELRRGDGVYGLRRAFVVAGAKTLVMSLWKVPDRETAKLMATFYERLASGLPRSQALREAQLAVRAERADPYFWGAFICQGDPGPLSLEGPP
jgi:CHAT domain-containing protein